MTDNVDIRDIHDDQILFAGVPKSIPSENSRDQIKLKLGNGVLVCGH